MRDFQQHKCYSWEDLHVHNRDRSVIPFDQVQAIVDYVWQGEGLAHPPKVREMDKRNTTALASADRLGVWVRPEGIKTTHLLHELAHSLTSLHDGRNAAHGPRFVGVFFKLLVKYARFDLCELEYTARSAGVKFNYDGKVI